jgi:hypothetical protein
MDRGLGRYSFAVLKDGEPIHPSEEEARLMVAGLTEIEKLQADNERLKKEALILNRQLGSQAVEIDDYSAENASLTAQLAEAKEERDEAKAEVAWVINKINVCHPEILADYHEEGALYAGMNVLSSHAKTYENYIATRKNDIAELQDTVASLTSRLTSISAERDKAIVELERFKGSMWHWQTDGDNDLESLTCPVLIQAGDLRRLLAISDCPMCDGSGWLGDDYGVCCSECNDGVGKPKPAQVTK